MLGHIADKYIKIGMSLVDILDKVWDLALRRRLNVKLQTFIGRTTLLRWSYPTPNSSVSTL